MSWAVRLVFCVLGLRHHCFRTPFEAGHRGIPKGGFKGSKPRLTCPLVTLSRMNGPTPMVPSRTQPLGSTFLLL